MDSCFAFPEVAWEPGTLKAIGLVAGAEVCKHELTTAGAAKQIKLTPILGPGGWQADGEDVALIDVEVLDEKGRRCPTDDARIDFELHGHAIWRGGYNSGKVRSTNNLYLNTECGINRVALRSTLEPGAVVVKATRGGLDGAEITLNCNPVKVINGLSDVSSRRFRSD